MIKSKKVWFRAKNYGWGWYPVTWQGWVILAGYIFLMVKTFEDIDSKSHSASDTMLNFLPRVFVLTVVLIIICFLTGERPEWRWGKKKS